MAARDARGHESREPCGPCARRRIICAKTSAALSSENWPSRGHLPRARYRAGRLPTSRLPVRMAKLTYSENRTAPFVRRLPSSEAGNDGGQLDRLHRLGHVHAVARRNRAQAILDASVRRERDGGRGATARAVEHANLADERIAVLAGHFDVGDQHVRALLT